MGSHVGTPDILEDDAVNLLVLAKLADYPVRRHFWTPLESRVFLDELDFVENHFSRQSFQVILSQRNEIKVKKILTLNFKVEAVLVSLKLRKTTFQLPSVNIVDHLDGKGVANFLALDNSAFLRFGPEVGCEDFNHTSLYRLIVGDLYRDDFFLNSPLHIYDCEHALFNFLLEEVLIFVSADTFRLAWAFGYQIEGHSTNLKS